jgi:hypothetical protein
VTSASREDSATGTVATIRPSAARR